MDPSAASACSTACVFDSNGDGDCHRCHKRGGCVAFGGPFHATETQVYAHGLLISNAASWIDAVARGAGYERIAESNLEAMEQVLRNIRAGLVR